MQTVNRLKSKRKRKAYDFYETPVELAKAALDVFNYDERGPSLPLILDPGAGRGIWGKALHEELFAPPTGVELQPIDMPAHYLIWYKETNFLEFSGTIKYHLIVGNPPYSLAEEFIRHSHELLKNGGYCFFLLRLAFLESKKRHFGLFTAWRPKRVYVLSRRPSFFTTKSGSKTTDALSYAMFLWQKGWEGDTTLDWLHWEYD